jgi:predicted Zn finger-like uncharacterized protein
MRLVCPNCEAKYEVPEDAIPETGRDVQCANCGHAWYQMRSRAAVAEPVAAAPVVAPPTAKTPEPAPAPEPEPEQMPAPESEPPEPELEVKPEVAMPDLAATAPEAPSEAVADPVVESAAEPDPVVDPVVEPVVEPVPEPVPEISEPAAIMGDPAQVDAPAVTDLVAEPVPEADEDDSLAVTPDPLAATAAPAAYAVDESVLAILREEAEREAQARKADTARPLEVQPDLGIMAAASVKKSVEGLGVDAGTSAAAEDGDDKLGGRKTRLPDVEEINSTLRPDEQLVGDNQGDMAAAPGEARSSFRSGFLLVMVVAILGAALYISADALAEAVPSLAGVLKSYVSMVDGLRLQLDGLMQSATVAINGSAP